MSRPAPKVAPGAKSDFRDPKVTFSLRKWFWIPKVTFGARKSLFRSQSHFSRFRPPRNVDFYKHYKGFEAVARAGAENAEFAKFSGKVSFGAKMSSKVTLSDFDTTKVTFRAQARRCASRQWFLGVLCGPRERKCHFFAQKSCLGTFCDLGVQK